MDLILFLRHHGAQAMLGRQLLATLAGVTRTSTIWSVAHVTAHPTLQAAPLGMHARGNHGLCLPFASPIIASVLL